MRTTHKNLRVRGPLALCAAVSLAVAGMGVSSAADDASANDLNPVGTRHVTDTHRYGVSTPALRWTVHDALSMFFPGGLDRAYDGARIDINEYDSASRTAVWPFVSRATDGAVTTLHYGGSVNMMAYCIGQDGGFKVEARGNCQDDMTLTDPVITINSDTKEITFAVTAYYHDKATDEYHGPEQLTLGIYDPESPKTQEIYGPYDAPIEFGVRDQIATWKNVRGYSTDGYQALLPVFGAFASPAMEFSYPTQAADSGDNLEPVTLGRYNKAELFPASYPEGGHVAVGNTATLQPTFTDPNGETIPTPKGVTFSMVEGSSSSITVDPDTGEVTLRPESQDIGYGNETSIVGQVEVAYPDTSANLVLVTYTTDGKPETDMDSFAPGEGTTVDGVVLHPGKIIIKGMKLYDADRGQFTTNMQAVGQGLVVANDTHTQIIKGGPWGYGGGFPFDGLDKEAQIALVPQSSKTYYASGNKLSVISTTATAPDTIYSADGQISALGITTDYKHIAILVRKSDGSGELQVFDTGPDYDPSDRGKKEGKPLVSTVALPSATELFGQETQQAGSLWGTGKQDGIGEDFLALPDGSWLWINDVPLADGQSSTLPLRIDPATGDTTVMRAATQQFAGVRSVEHQLHAAVQNGKVSIFNQQGITSDDPEGGDPQNIGFYTFDTGAAALTAQSVAGAVNGVGPVVSATFTSDGLPAFVDNQGYLTVVDPQSRLVVRGAQTFVGMEKLASNNRRILLRKGEWFHTLGQETAESDALLQEAHPAEGAATKLAEPLESALYGVDTSVAQGHVGEDYRGVVAVTLSKDGSTLDTAPKGARFHLVGDSADQGFDLDPVTGELTAPASAMSDGNRSLAVRVDYADGSSDDATVTVVVDGVRAKVSYPSGTTVSDAVAGMRASVSPKITGVQSSDVTFALGTGAPKNAAVDDASGEVSVKLTAADIKKGSVSVPVTATVRDGETFNLTAALTLVAKPTPPTTSKKPAPPTTSKKPQQEPTPPTHNNKEPQQEGSSGSAVAGIGVVAVILALVAAVLAAMGGGGLPGIALPR